MNMMKTIIVGANGGIGQIVSQQLSERDDHEPIAMIRDASQKEFFENISVDTTLGDLEWSADELANTI